MEATARLFTKALVNQDMYACTQIGPGHICYYYNYVAILDGNADYTRVYFPIGTASELMRFGLSLSEIEAEYHKYWEAVHRAASNSESHVKFDNYLATMDKKFNSNSGRTAIVINEKYYVTKAKIDTAFLLENGFKRDTSLFVPFSWNETYVANYGRNDCVCIRG